VQNRSNVRVMHFLDTILNVLHVLFDLLKLLEIWWNLRKLCHESQMIRLLPPRPNRVIFDA
jgi:hypothetical protein